MAQVSCGKLGVGDTGLPAAQPLASSILVPEVPFSALMDSGAWLFPQALGMFSAALASGQLKTLGRVPVWKGKARGLYPVGTSQVEGT